MRTPLLAGNWKMHKTRAEALELVNGLLDGLEPLSGREVAVCPTYTALQTVGDALQGKPIALGAQDVYFQEQGAFTGAIAPMMLQDLGCRYVIVGHSERREHFGEDDATVNRKLLAVLRHQMRPILCVGESKPQRDAGEADAVVIAQIKADLEGVATDQMTEVVIAYEPIWAIGTGDTATPDDCQAMHSTIRNTLTDLYDAGTAQRVRILYGGSVKPNNVDSIMAQPDVDGALVGGASLKAADFLRIVHFE